MTPDPAATSVPVGSALPRRMAAEERPAVDLRLVPAFVASWAAAAWATAAGSGAASAAAGCCALLGVAVPLIHSRAVRRHAGRPSSGGGRAGPFVRAGSVSVGLPGTVLTLAAVALVLAATSAQTAQRSRPPLSGWIADRAVVEGSGRIVTDPHRVASRAPRGRAFGEARFTVRVRLQRVSARSRTVDADAPVLVIGGPAWGELSAGGHVTLTARLEATRPGDAVVAVADALGPPRAVTPGGRVWRLADRLRAGLRAACDGLPQDAGALLPSLVVGDTSRLPESLRADLQIAGLTHLTAVSGANVAIIAGAVLWLGTRLGVPRAVRLGSACAVVAGFVVVARPEPSVLRAAVMGGVALLGLGLSRRPRGVPALAAAGTVLLAVDPWLSRSAGFALSCVATAALLWLAPVWTSRLSRRLPTPLAAAVAVPAAAQAACGPVVVLLAPSVSVVAVPANLLADPAVAPATVAGVLAALVAPISPAAAHGLAWVGSLATGWIVRVAHAGAGLPLAVLPWPSGMAGALLLGGLTAVLVTVSLVPPEPRRPSSDDVPGPAQARPTECAERSRGAARARRGVRLLAFVLALALAAVAGWLLGPRLPGRWPWPVPWPGDRWPPPEWAIVQCDVGQGAATVIRSGPDRAVLLDTGPLPSAADQCLRRLGVRHLDIVLLTHHHADHVLGLPGALRHRDARQILVSPLGEPAGQAAEVRRFAAAAGVPVAEGWAGATGATEAGGWAVHWRVLAPTDPPAPPPPGEDGDGTAVNESSLVTSIEVTGPGGSLRVLGLGDLETRGQQRLLEGLETGRVDVGGPVDVLVVAHHGSARQEPRLCAVLAPRTALIGVGADNDYGHPAPSALAMLRDCGPAVHRTDLAGSIALVPYPDDRLTVVTERTQPRRDHENPR